MTTNYHDAIVNGDPRKNDAAIFNDPLETIDAQITANTSEMVTARGGYQDLDTRLDAFLATDVVLDTRIDNLIIGAGTSSAEVVDARNAGNTDGSSPAVLSDRLAYAANNEYHPMAYGAAGDGSTDDRAVLNTLLNTTIGGVNATVIIDRAYRLSADLTVPLNVKLQFTGIGKFIVDSFSVRSAGYQWTFDADGRYYLSVAGTGVSPTFSEPGAVYENGVALTKTAKGMLSSGEWAWGTRTDGAFAGEYTIFIRLSDDTDPDSKAAGYVTAAYNLTINGPISAGPQKIVNDYVTFFGDAITDRLYPHWWWTSGDWRLAIQTALTTAAQISSSSSKPIVFLPPGQIYDCDTGFTVDCGKNVLHGSGSILDFSGGTAIKAITIIQTSTLSRPGTFNNPTLQGITLIGDGIAGSSVGVYISAGEHDIAGGININASLHNITIRDFGIGIEFYDNAWGCDVHSFNIQYCAIGVKQTSGADTPERLALSNGLIGECTLAVSQGVGMWFFSQCSFDYNGKVLDGASGRLVSFDQCHMEQATTPFITTDETLLRITNCVLWYAGSTQSINLIEHTQDFQTNSVIVRDCMIEAPAWTHVKVVSGTGRAKISGLTSGATAVTGATTLMLCAQSSVVPNGTFENTIDGWAVTGAAASDNTQAHSGTYSLKIPNTGTALTIFRLEPGQTISGQFWIYTSSATSAGILGTLGFLAHDASTLLGTHAMTFYPTTVTVATWTLIGFHMHVGDIPGGTKFANFYFSNALGGNVWIDDLVVNVF